MTDKDECKRSKEELKKIYSDPTELKKYELGNENEITVGLALSGGGIRSASFALGVVQAFIEQEEKNIKMPFNKLFDYLSTVSGGGI